MTEKEYIEREAAITTYKTFGHLNLHNALEAFKEIPSADVQEVKKGRWEYTVIEGDLLSEIPTVVKGVCSVCHNFSEEMPKWIYDDGGRIWFNYCPNCGADMREK